MEEDPIQADHGFDKGDRLRRRPEFLAVQERGTRGHAGYFLAFYLPTPTGPDGPCRLGITITKKVGGAVFRNRIKRLVREAFRRNKSVFPRGIDLVLVVKQGVGPMTFAEVQEDLLRVARRLRPPPDRPR